MRDRQRAWCPRCHGALMAPDPRWNAPAPAQPPIPVQPPGRPPAQPPGPPRQAPRLPSGFRWIAVRPGPPPPPRHRRRPLGPTPRYTAIPRWGLVDPFIPAVTGEAGVRTGPSPATVRAALLAAVSVFGLAAFVHVIRYVLLLINRTTLLPPLVASAALWLGVVVSLAALVAVVVAAVVMTSWLVARRAAVFRHRGQDDPRPAWALWVGCLTPLVNLVWAPVFVIELAHAEDSHARLRGPITAWWIAWIFATGLAIFATATSFTSQPQGIADNTVTTILTYLLGVAVIVLLWQVFDAFVRKPVERPLHRWVIVAPGEKDTAPGEAGTDTEAPAESSAPVEQEQQEPAA